MTQNFSVGGPGVSPFPFQHNYNMPYAGAPFVGGSVWQGTPDVSSSFIMPEYTDFNSNQIIFGLMQTLQNLFNPQPSYDSSLEVTGNFNEDDYTPVEDDDDDHVADGQINFTANDVLASLPVSKPAAEELKTQADAELKAKAEAQLKEAEEKALKEANEKKIKENSAICRDLFVAMKGAGTNNTKLEEAIARVTKDNVVEVIGLWNKLYAPQMGNENLVQTLLNEFKMEFFFKAPLEKSINNLKDTLTERAKETGKYQIEQASKEKNELISKENKAKGLDVLVKADAFDAEVTRLNNAWFYTDSEYVKAFDDMFKPLWKIACETQEGELNPREIEGIKAKVKYDAEKQVRDKAEAIALAQKHRAEEAEAEAAEAAEARKAARAKAKKKR